MTKQELKKALLSMVTAKAELVGGEFKVDLDIDLDGATGVLFEVVLEPAAKRAVEKVDNPLVSSIEQMVMPLIKKEAMEFMAELEDKLEAKIDSKLGQDEA